MYEESKLKRNSKIEDGQSTLPFVTKYRHSDARQKALISSVALNLIVDCDLPIHSVERAGFLRFIHRENPYYNTITSKKTDHVQFLYIYVLYVIFTSLYIYTPTIRTDPQSFTASQHLTITGHYCQVMLRIIFIKMFKGDQW